MCGKGVAIVGKSALGVAFEREPLGCRSTPCICHQFLHVTLVGPLEEDGDPAVTPEVGGGREGVGVSGYQRLLFLGGGFERGRGAVWCKGDKQLVLDAERRFAPRLALGHVRQGQRHGAQLAGDHGIALARETNSGWSRSRCQLPSACRRHTWARAPAASLGGVEVRAMSPLIRVGSGGFCSKWGALASIFSHSAWIASRPTVIPPGG